MLGVGDSNRAQADELLLRTANQRPPSLDDLRREARPYTHRRHLETLSALDSVATLQSFRVRVVQPDARRIGGEELVDLVADQLDDGLEVQLLDQALSDAVDDLELRRPLSGFLEEPIGLVE